MAILCLADDLPDLKRRLGDIFIGFTPNREPIRAHDLSARGPWPPCSRTPSKLTLIQSLEGNPAIMHGGPFANIAQGTNTVIATRTGLAWPTTWSRKLVSASILGGEKFLDIKCQSAGLDPCAVVLVATVRGAEIPRRRGTAAPGRAQRPRPDPGPGKPDQTDRERAHLRPHAHRGHQRFDSDTDEEHQAIVDHCQFMGVQAAIMDALGARRGRGRGIGRTGRGHVRPLHRHYQPLYAWSRACRRRDHRHRVWRGRGGNTRPEPCSTWTRSSAWGWSICRCASPRPKAPFRTIPSCAPGPEISWPPSAEVEIAAGAGFLVPLAGNMMRMPGLPETPSAEKIDIDENGVISGLF